MSPANEIDRCEVCGSLKLDLVLDLGSHPLCDDLIRIGDESRCVEYPIEILYCDRCCTAHQRYQVPKRDLFPNNYHYRSRFTADVLQGMSQLVAACEEHLGESLHGKTVLDVGCNDGSLLDICRQRGAKTIGVEPTDAYRDAVGKGHDLFTGFFGPDTAAEVLAKHGQPDVITFTNVFAHIENLPELLSGLRTLVSPQTIVVVENHYLGSVLDRYQFDTFYHEHPRTYSLTSFRYIASSLSLELKAFEFPSRYGGNIRVMLGGPGVSSNVVGSSLTQVLERERGYGQRLREMQDAVTYWKDMTTSRLRALVDRHGPIPAKAFPGRAAILIKLLEVDTESLQAVYERPGSMKIGHYVPGTRIPIRSDDELFGRDPPPPVVLNLAWHISDEIRSYLRRLGYTGDVIDVLDPEAVWV